jgi:hypothetical protein
MFTVPAGRQGHKNKITFTVLFTKLSHPLFPQILTP